MMKEQLKMEIDLDIAQSKKDELEELSEVQKNKIEQEQTKEEREKDKRLLKSQQIHWAQVLEDRYINIKVDLLPGAHFQWGPTGKKRGKVNLKAKNFVKKRRSKENYM